MKFIATEKSLEKIEKKYGTILKRIEKLSELSPIKGRFRVMEEDLERIWKFISGLHLKIKKSKYKIRKLNKLYDQALKTFEEEVKATHERLNKLEDEMKAVGKLPKFYKEVKEKFSELEKQYNSIASDVVERIKALEEKIKPEEKEKLEELLTLRDQVESIRKSMLTFNKLWEDYKKEIEEKLGLRAKPLREQKLPKNLADELASLRKMVEQISSENEQLRKITRDIRMIQMTSVTADMFADLTSRVSTIEKKISEIEEEMSKLIKSKPVVLE